MARSTDTIKFLTLDELARLFIATRANARDRALFLVAYRHGLRASEVGLLRIDDIDLRALRLTVHRIKSMDASRCKTDDGVGCGCVNLSGLFREHCRSWP